jgi:hypothetical protein
MSRITSLGLVLAFVVSACVVNEKGDDQTGDDSGSSSTGSGSTGGGSSGNVAPRLGGWHYTGVTVVSNTCNSNVNRGEAGNFAVDQGTATSFRIVPNDGTAPFTCTLSKGAFTCPDRVSFVQDNRPSIDAVVTIHVTAEGAFPDATHGTGSQDGTVNCVGTACSVLGPWPCTFTQGFAIRAL